MPSLSSVRIPVTEMIQETISRLIFMLDGGELASANLLRRAYPARLRY
ncbi:hypothetical protein ACVXG7_14580 [Enterobacter hormaechei]